MRVAGGHCAATAIPETAPECNAWRDFGVSCKKTLETRVVSDGVEGVSAYPEGGAGLDGDVPDEAVDAGSA